MAISTRLTVAAHPKPKHAYHHHSAAAAAESTSACEVKFMAMGLLQNMPTTTLRAWPQLKRKDCASSTGVTVPQGIFGARDLLFTRNNVRMSLTVNFLLHTREIPRVKCRDQAVMAYSAPKPTPEGKGTFSMLHIIWSIIVGFIVGLIACAIMGNGHVGFIVTVLIGVVGSIVGGLIARLFSKPADGALFHPAGFLLSIVGACLVIFLINHFG
jgi:uncharacterized membrane protein YeaQ/YmgE (transglycosylase-associated protein family)